MLESHIDEKYLNLHAVEYYGNTDFWLPIMAAWAESSKYHIRRQSPHGKYLQTMKDIRYSPLGIKNYLEGFLETYPTPSMKRTVYISEFTRSLDHLPNISMQSMSDQEIANIITLDNGLDCQTCERLWPCSRYLNAIAQLHILRKLKDLEW